MPEYPLLTERDGMGPAGLGQQIRQGLRMCLVIDRTDAGLAWGCVAGGPDTALAQPRWQP